MMSIFFLDNPWMNILSRKKPDKAQRKRQLQAQVFYAADTTKTSWYIIFTWISVCPFLFSSKTNPLILFFLITEFAPLCKLYIVWRKINVRLHLSGAIILTDINALSTIVTSWYLVYLLTSHLFHEQTKRTWLEFETMRWGINSLKTAFRLVFNRCDIVVLHLGSERPPPTQL